MFEGFFAVWGLKMVLYMTTLGVCLWRVRVWKERYYQMRSDWDSARFEISRLRDALKVQTDAVKKMESVAWEQSQRVIAATKRADQASARLSEIARKLNSAEIPKDPEGALQWLKSTTGTLGW